MKITKRLLSLVLSLLLCLSVAGCGSKPLSYDMKNMDMSSTDCYTYLGRSEKEILEHFSIEEDSIASRSEFSKGNFQIELKDAFPYNESKATVFLKFSNDKLVGISYIFEDGKPAFAYAKAAEAAFSKKLTPIPDYSGNLDTLSESVLEEAELFRESKKYEIEDKYEILKDIKKGPMPADELALSLTLSNYSAKDGTFRYRMNVGFEGYAVPKTK